MLVCESRSVEDERMMARGFCSGSGTLRYHAFPSFSSAFTRTWIITASLLSSRCFAKDSAKRPSLRRLRCLLRALFRLIAGVRPHDKIAERARQIGGQLYELVFDLVPKTGALAIKLIQALLKLAISPLQPADVCK